MKKLLRSLLCGAMLTLAMSTAAFAAETDLLISPAPAAIPERQGDFYVMVNGEFVTFPDAVPQGRDNRSFLPMAATFSQLGFAEEDMTWNTDGQITASKDDLTIALTIGKNEIVVTQGEESKTIPTDVAPYVDSATWRTYVPFGLVADALGYKVGWDGTTGTVIIDDLDAILAKNTETYELLDKYLAYSKEFSEKKTKVTGTYSLSMYTCDWAQESLDEMSVSLLGDYEMLTANSTALQFETDMALEMAAYTDGVDVTEEVLVSDDVAIPESIDFELRGDLAEGVLYFQSAALSALMEQPDMANAWYKLDMAAMLAGSGMVWSDLMAYSGTLTEMDGAQLMRYMLELSPVSSVSMTSGDYLAMYNAMLGDSAFVKDGKSYVNDMSELGIPMTLVLYTNNSGSQVTGYGIEMYMSDPSMGTFLITAAMDGSELAIYMGLDTSAAADLSAAEGSFLVLEMTMDGIYKSASTAPAAEPPAGAVIVDLAELAAEN